MNKLVDYQINENMIIRPSSIANSLSCGWQWFNTYMLGRNSIPSNRAAIGTAIHAGVERLWKEAQQTREVGTGLAEYVGAAQIEYTKAAEGVVLEDFESVGGAQREVEAGVASYLEDIAPYATIPDDVEVRYTVRVPNSPVIKAISGTLDYRAGAVIADVKTSQRKPVLGNYDLQQTTYKMLVEANGVTVKQNLIHGVVLRKTGVDGMILELDPTRADERMAFTKVTLKSLIARANAVFEGLDPKLVFSGNPKHYLCSEKYCAFYKECGFRKGWD